MAKPTEEKTSDFKSAHDKELDAAKFYTPQQTEKLEKINRSLGKWKRKTLTGKELYAIAHDKDLPTD